jgi:hypothetical protein
VKTLVAALVVVSLAPVALAASGQELVVLPKPGFPAPARDVTSAGPRLELVSSRYRDPGELPPAPPPPPASAAKRLHGADLDFAVRQRPYLFLVYGGRYAVSASRYRYAIDFLNFLRPPTGAWTEDVTWLRQVGNVLYVENTHLTYATATRGRNAYVSAIDVRTMKTLWRSPALVANARTFVVTGDLIVSGYGFTAEPDFLYLLDRRTGRVLDRLPVPSAPEVIKLRGDRLHVRTYDRDVVARIVRP